MNDRTDSPSSIPGPSPHRESCGAFGRDNGAARHLLVALVLFGLLVATALAAIDLCADARHAPRPPLPDAIEVALGVAFVATLVIACAGAFLLASFQRRARNDFDFLSTHVRELALGADDVEPLRPRRAACGARRPDALDELAQAIDVLQERMRQLHRDASARQRDLEARLIDSREQLQEAREDALASDRAKSEFLSNISHEIRTPMNGLLGAINLLRHGSPSVGERADYLGIAASSGETVLALINDVLDYTKLRAHKIVARVEPVTVNAIAGVVLNQHRALSASKGLELVLDTDPALDAPRLGDSLRLRQVLLNLIGNAVKFTEEGSIYLRTRLWTRPDGTPVVRIQVQDTGVGIHADDHERIFEAFEQIESPQQRRTGGTGLGLAIARGLIEAMRGTLELDSEPGRGSLFKMELPWPAAPVEVEVTPAGVAPIEEVRPLSGRVLLVEDNGVSRLIAARMLKLLGLDVVEAGDGEEALEVLGGADGASISMVLMDCQMPRIDGFEATRRWRAHEAAHHAARLPIIALTANVLRDDIERCAAAGMDDHLGKPFSIDALRRLVQRTRSARGRELAHE